MKLSSMVLEVFLELTPLVEPLSMDEAYLDISAEVHWEGVNETAKRIRALVMERTGAGGEHRWWGHPRRWPRSPLSCASRTAFFL